MVKDLNFDKITSFTTLSLKAAWNVMKENNMKTLPVADANNHFIRCSFCFNLTLLHGYVQHNIIKSNTTLENILDTLSATACYVNEAVKTFLKIVVSAWIQRAWLII